MDGFGKMKRFESEGNVFGLNFMVGGKGNNFWWREDERLGGKG